MLSLNKQFNTFINYSLEGVSKSNCQLMNVQVIERNIYFFDMVYKAIKCELSS